MSIPNYADKNLYPDTQYLCPKCKKPLIGINDDVFRCRDSDWHGIYMIKRKGAAN